MAFRTYFIIWFSLLFTTLQLGVFASEPCYKTALKIAVPHWRSAPTDSTSHRTFYKRLPPKVRALYEKYLHDEVAGLESMRGDNGLVMDTVYVKQDGKGGFQIKPYKTVAAPTDVALDLLAQTGLADHRAHKGKALSNIDRTLKTLEGLPFHPNTGLFYRLYETTKENAGSALEKDVSSVDNMHLAISLWTISRKFPGTPRGASAQKIFNRMNFSSFYDAETKLLGGNLKYSADSVKPEWKLEPYRFHFGSEARSVYLAGHALGLFRDHRNSTAIEDSLKTVPLEVSRDGGKDVLNVWDGGSFQSLLPRLLLNEEIYSPFLRTSALRTGNQMLKDGPTKTLPGGYSAAVNDVVEKNDGSVDIIYSGKIGNPRNKISLNEEPVDHSVVTSHAILLGAATDPVSFADKLAKLETVQSGPNRAYVSGFGWIDSMSKGKVNSAGVGVDKGIEVLSLLQILDPEGLSESGRQMQMDPEVRRRLISAYDIINSRWQSSRID